MSAALLGSPRLRRGDLPRPPVRIVHLGLGAFHRAHQAWYTARAVDASEWGIAAFTGRSPEAARVLAEQDGVYTLVERGAAQDRFEIIGSIVEARDASETTALRRLVSDPAVTVVTLTVTEKGYRLGPDGTLDLGDADVRADLATLQAASSGGGVSDGALRTMPARLFWALDGRFALRDDAMIAVVSCDNLPGNGAAARAAIEGIATVVHGSVPAWLDACVDWIETSIDRITPRTTTRDLAIVEENCRYLDRSPVVTEPFSSWILSGEFRAARPSWETAGAEFVEELAPFESRKLWMLNGAHSLLAYAGILRGHDTVAAAMADPICASMVNDLWDLDESILRTFDADLAVDAYRAALVARFENPAIVHQLRQIAADGSVKLRVRIADPVLRVRTAGDTGDAGLRVIAAWIRFVRDELARGHEIDDVAADELARRAASEDPVSALLSLISPELADGPNTLSRVRAQTLEGAVIG